MSKELSDTRQRNPDDDAEAYLQFRVYLDNQKEVLTIEEQTFADTLFLNSIEITAKCGGLALVLGILMKKFVSYLTQADYAAFVANKVF